MIMMIKDISYLHRNYLNEQQFSSTARRFCWLECIIRLLLFPTSIRRLVNAIKCNRHGTSLSSVLSFTFQDSQRAITLTLNALFTAAGILFTLVKCDLDGIRLRLIHENFDKPPQHCRLVWIFFLWFLSCDTPMVSVFRLCQQDLLMKLTFDTVTFSWQIWRYLLVHWCMILLLGIREFTLFAFFAFMLAWRWVAAFIS